MDKSRYLTLLFVIALSACVTAPYPHIDGLPSLAIAPFEYSGPGSAPLALSDIVHADLERSGRLNLVPRGFLPSLMSDDSRFDAALLRQRGIDQLLVGSVRYLDAGKYQVQFRLYDLSGPTQTAGMRYVVEKETLRTIAHQISNSVHEKLLGVRGAFTTRIAYVTEEYSADGRNFFIKLADADGNNIQIIAKSKVLFPSLAWSPDGKQLAYESLEEGRSRIFLQELETGTRAPVAAYPGSNSAPAISPDGKNLAFVRSESSESGIYQLDLAAKKARFIATTEPLPIDLTWLPDGQHLIAVSIRYGKAEISRVSVNDGLVQPQPGQSTYFSRVALAPDGQAFAVVAGDESNLQLSIVQIDTGRLKPISGPIDARTPTSAPNGGMIMYVTTEGGRSVLATISSNGRTNRIVRTENGQIHNVVWSPYLHSRDY